MSSSNSGAAKHLDRDGSQTAVGCKRVMSPWQGHRVVCFGLKTTDMSIQEICAARSVDHES